MHRGSSLSSWRWKVAGIVGGVLTCVLVTASPIPASAAPPNRQACIDAYEDAQVSMRRTRLLHAREPLATCLDQACPSTLRTDCAEWLKDVESRTPTVVVECVVDGKSVRDVKLFVDDKLHVGGIDGRAIDLDPGTHKFRVEPHDGTKSVSVESIVREGEKLKPIRLELPSRLPPSSTKPSSSSSLSPTQPIPPKDNKETDTSPRPIPWTVYAAGGVGALALGGFTVFAISGSSGKSDLEPCKPDCTQSQIDSVHKRFVIADVFLGVSVVALAAATVLYVTRK